MTLGRLSRSEVNQGTDSDSSSAVMGRTEEGEVTWQVETDAASGCNLQSRCRTSGPGR